MRVIVIYQMGNKCHVLHLEIRPHYCTNENIINNFWSFQFSTSGLTNERPEYSLLKLIQSNINVPFERVHDGARFSFQKREAKGELLEKRKHNIVGDVRFSFRFFQTGPQLLFPSKALGHVANHRHYPLDAPSGLPQKLDRELDGKLAADLVERGHSKQLAIPVTGESGLHHPFLAGPMAGAEPVRNDEVHGSTEGFCGGMTEYPFRRGVPVAQRTVPVGDNHSVR